jgi:DNA-binding MarR family transcriptional regulator
VSLLELTSHTQMDKGQISRVVGQLEDDGLLAREADANDGRRQILSLTESGKELFRQTIEVSEIRQNEILSVLTGDELEALKNTLNKLSGHMRVRLDDEKTLAATPDED